MEKRLIKFSSLTFLRENEKVSKSHLFQMRDVISHLKSITTANSPNGSLVHHPPMRVADKEVQTDFPVALLENYVVNNRKRILKLLGYSNAAAQNAPSSDHPLRSSWNPLPNRYVHYQLLQH